MLKKSTTMCSKDAEIKAIENLFNMNGYFAEYFSENEVEHMIQNIKNDLTFGMGVLVSSVDHDKEVAKLEQKVSEVTAKYEEKLAQQKDNYKASADSFRIQAKHLGAGLLKAAENGDKEAADVAKSWLGMKGVVEIKLEFGYKLTQEEVSYVMSNLNGR